MAECIVGGSRRAAFFMHMSVADLYATPGKPFCFTPLPFTFLPKKNRTQLPDDVQEKHLQRRWQWL